MIKRFVFSILILGLVSSVVYALPDAIKEKTVPEFIQGTYRRCIPYNDSITGAADGSNAQTVTLDFVADFIMISCDDTTNELHIQFFTDDGDSTYIKPSYVYYVEPDETYPFYLRGVKSIKVNLPYDGDSGKFRIVYCKI